MLELFASTWYSIFVLVVYIQNMLWQSDFCYHCFNLPFRLPKHSFKPDSLKSSIIDRLACLIKGDPKEVNIVILLWRIEKCLNGTNILSIKEFILGGSIIHHSFTLGQKFAIKTKIVIFLEINGKWLIIQGKKIEFIVQHPAFFCQF